MLKAKLEDGGVPDIFNYIHTNKAGGVLEVSSRRHIAKFLFKEGRLLLASSTSVDLRLSDILFAAGDVTPALISKAMEIHLKEFKKRRIGRILNEDCGVPKKTIQRALEALYVMITEEVFSWENGELTFDQEANPSDFGIDDSLLLDNGVETGQLLFTIASKTSG
ncbi:MAG: hypothetical protein C0608_02815 [Deltaproteobacteria bacterium]|nr:MAG: hypothetical protein C0608_02815 [Deltaproteobacteria bacterium]